MKYPFVVQGHKLGGSQFFLDLLGGLGLAFKGASVEFGEWSLWAAANLATKDNLPRALHPGPQTLHPPKNFVVFGDELIDQVDQGPCQCFIGCRL